MVHFSQLNYNTDVDHHAVSVVYTNLVKMNG